MPKTERKAVAQPPTRRYEPFKVSVVGAAILVLGLAIGAIAIHGALWDWLNHLPGPPHADAATRWNPASDTLASNQTARLQLAPRDELATSRAVQESNLNTFGWVDREHRIVKAPIDMAMRQIVERGLPQWSTNAGISPLELQWQRAANNAKGKP